MMNEQSQNWTDLLISFGPIIIGLFGIYFGYRQYKKSLDARRNEHERNEIYKKLNEFYGPLLQLRKKSKMLYNKFSTSLRKEDPNFRTLTYLLKDIKFSENQRCLLEEIIKIGEDSENLIHNKSGLIDDKNLRIEILPRLTTHYLILRLAFNGKLSGESEEFRDYTFPRDVDELLEKRISFLSKRLEELNKI